MAEKQKHGAEHFSRSELITWAHDRAAHITEALAPSGEGIRDILVDKTDAAILSAIAVMLESDTAELGQCQVKIDRLELALEEERHRLD